MNGYAPEFRTQIGWSCSGISNQDAYVEEDEYRSHVFTLNNGVKGGNGTIRLEVSVDGKEYGWGQMDFSNGNLNITTGAY